MMPCAKKKKKHGVTTAASKPGTQDEDEVQTSMRTNTLRGGRG